MMRVTFSVFILSLSTLYFQNGKALPSINKNNLDGFWSKVDFETAERNKEQLKPIEEVSLARVGNEGDFEEIFPRMIIKTNYKNEEGDYLKSQLHSISELSSKDKETLALNFFSKYGYYNGFEMVEKQELIKRMQHNHGLSATGDLNDETIAMMITPRCGNPDTPQHFNTYPGKPRWKKRTLSYKITGYTPEISPCFTRNVVAKAFRFWSRVVELNFVKKDASEKADIEIKFGYDKHGDGFPFDGVGSTLAHAFPPGKSSSAGDIHFDEDEFWSMGYGPVKTTYYGNANGAKCVFPFKYNGTLHRTCIKDGKDHDWCSTTSDYDNDRKFGFCPSPELFTYGGNSNGNSCYFPFVYEGKLFSSCTSEGNTDGYKWCATTYDYDNDKKWGLCPTQIDTSRKSGKSLLIVAIHEIGHAIGLDHSNNNKAIMYPTYKLVKKIRLSYDDVKGARSLYPPRKTKLTKITFEKCGFDKFL